MQNIILILLLVLTVTFFTRGLYAQFTTDLEQAKAPVVVELFTSQSCSSCPPADRILQELAKQENVIALGCHVSYWNHLHWKDTVSNEFCDIRQHGYGAYNGTKRVYTPQMVVNGTHEFVGSHSSAVNAALKSVENAPLKPIQIEEKPDGTLAFTLPSADLGSYRLWAFGYTHKVHEDIPSGENRGRTLSYSNPVHTYTNLGSWDGQSAIHKFNKPSETLDGIAILAQQGGYGQIIAAGKLVFDPVSN